MSISSNSSHIFLNNLLLPTLCIVLFSPSSPPFEQVLTSIISVKSHALLPLGFGCHHNELMLLYFDNCQIFDIWLQPSDRVVEALEQAQVFDKYLTNTICQPFLFAGPWTLVSPARCALSRKNSNSVAGSAPSGAGNHR